MGVRMCFGVLWCVLFVWVGVKPPQHLFWCTLIFFLTTLPLAPTIAAMDRKKLQQAIAHNSHFTPSRKVSLYSNFARLEETNPDGYWANVDAWKEVLEDAVSSHAFEDATCISAGPELTAKLSDASNGTPLSLSCALDAMVSDGTLMPLSDFKRTYLETPQKGYISRAFGWTWGKLMGAGHFSSAASDTGDTLKQEKYVDLAALKATSKKFRDALGHLSAKRGNTQSAKIFDVHELYDTLQDQYSSVDIDCCLALASYNQEVFYNASEGLVKLRSAGPITDVDVNILGLNRHIQEVYLRELTLRDQIAQLDQQARAAIKQGDRRGAKLLLQKKSVVEKSQERTVAVIDQLETVLQKIDDANDNKQSYDAFQASSALLKKVNAGVSVEDMDEVIESIHDEIATTNELTSQLSDLNLNQPDQALNELELDEELEQMAKEEGDKKTAHMPSVPQHKPVSEEKQKVEQEESEHEEERPEGILSA